MVQFSGFASAELCIHSVIHTKVCGFPHSDIAVSLLYCQLLRAFRRLTRPSSPIIAKASTWCTYLLDSIIWSTCWLRLFGVDDQNKLQIPYFDTVYCFVVNCSCLLCSGTIDTIITQITVLVGAFSGCLNSLQSVQTLPTSLSLFVDFGFRFVKERCNIFCK